MKRHRCFCCYCGYPIAAKELDGKRRDFCGHCETVFYENPLPVAAAIVVNEQREVLLVKRRQDPYKDMWCLPIGFAESDEEVSQAALRELEEESGLTGELVRIIDVDTVDNYFYGSLAIVTYEVRATGGRLRPGDDASDAAFHPILKLPPLAWSSNEKAIQIYIDLYKDTWAMIESFQHLFPEQERHQTLGPGTGEPQGYLSNILVKLIARYHEEIMQDWMADVRRASPALMPYMDRLRGLNAEILQGLQTWLKGENGPDSDALTATGRAFRTHAVPLPETVRALALSRRSIWTHVIKKKILSSPLEIYTTLELNNRIIFYYDKVVYHLSSGYCA